MMGKRCVQKRGQKAVGVKNDEITVIPQVLEKIRGKVVMIDAMWSQTAITGKNKGEAG